MSNVCFDLTAEFNREERIAILASGQAVVWLRREDLARAAQDSPGAA